MNGAVDVVIPWVDGYDKNWLKKKAEYTGTKTSEKEGEYNTKARYRDYGTLKYLFRSIEKNATWVNHIFLVTDNQIPEWLNKDNRKVTIIDHKDFIPDKYLPTFNTNTIELNIHRIKALSENFVLFNDDMIINSKTEKNDFFKNELPVDVISFNVNNSHDEFSHILLNDMVIINKNFDKKRVIKNNFFKLFDFKNASQIIRTLLSLPWSGITGFYNPHLGVPYQKSAYEMVWKSNYDILNRTCSNKVRTFNDVSDWLIRYWQMCSGKFVQGKVSAGKFFTLNDIKELKQELTKDSKYKQICINDSDKQDHYEENIELLNEYLEKKFPDKSKFEI